MEIVDLGGVVTAEHRRVPPRDRPHSGAAGLKTLPQALASSADRTDDADPGDCDATLCCGHGYLDGESLTRERQIAADLTQIGSASAILASPSSVRLAMPWTNTGPMTFVAAIPPTTGHGGPFQACTMRTRVPPRSG